MNLKQLEVIQSTLKVEHLKHLKKYNAYHLILLAEAQEIETIEYSIEHRSNGEIVRVYFGVVGIGIIANYDVMNDNWYECYPHGNGGKNWSSGGTWSSHKPTKQPPRALIELVTYFVKQTD